MPGESQGQRSLAGYSPQGHRVGHDWATKHSTREHAIGGEREMHMRTPFISSAVAGGV